MFAKRLCAAALALLLVGCTPLAAFTGEMRGVSSHAALFFTADPAGTVKCQSAALSAIDQAIGAAIAAQLPKATAATLRATVSNKCEVLNGLVTSDAGGSPDSGMVPTQDRSAGSESAAGQRCGSTGPCEVSGAGSATSQPATR